MDIPTAVRTAIEAGPIAHVVTIAPAGRPQISMAWIGLEAEEIVIGTMFEQAKLRNMRRDPRMAISFETGRLGPMGLPGYIVLHGRARVMEGEPRRPSSGSHTRTSARMWSFPTSRTRRPAARSGSPSSGSPAATRRWPPNERRRAAGSDTLGR